LLPRDSYDSVIQFNYIRWHIPASKKAAISTCTKKINKKMATETIQNNENREYELGFMLTDDQAITSINEILTRHGAKVTFQSEIKRMLLAYPIKKETSAFFGYLYFFASSESVKEMNHELMLTSSVLRFIIVKDPIKKDASSSYYGTEQGRPSGAHKEEKSEEAPKAADAVTNEDLEKKLEEILN
jgi:ribosomal protein S6